MVPADKKELLLPSLAGIIFTIIFLVSLTPVSSNDIFWHLETGRYIYENTEIPENDPFSYTASTRPWRAHEWLADVLFFVIYQYCGGFAALIVLKATILGLTFFTIFKVSELRASPFISFVIVILGALASVTTFLIRPQIFTYLFFVITYLLLETFPRRKYLYGFPFLVFIWSHCHGAFVFGLFLFGLFFLYRFIEELMRSPQTVFREPHLRNLGLTGFFSLLTPLLNKDGIEVYLYIFEYLGDTLHKQFIFEWFPPNFQEELPLELFFFILLVSFLVIPQKRRLKALVLLFPFIHLMLTSGRNIPFFVLLCIPFISESLSFSVSKYLSPQDRQGDRVVVNRLSHLMEAGPKGSLILPLVVAIVFSVLIMRTPPFTENGPDEQWLNPRKVPIKAVAKLNELYPDLTLFNYYDWGGYILWKTDIPVFIDGRADLYSPDILKEYFLMMKVQDDSWKRVFQLWNVEIVLIPSRSALSKLLDSQEMWKIVYKDSRAVLYVKNSAINRMQK